MNPFNNVKKQMKKVEQETKMLEEKFHDVLQSFSVEKPIYTSIQRISFLDYSECEWFYSDGILVIINPVAGAFSYRFKNTAKLDNEVVPHAFLNDNLVLSKDNQFILGYQFVDQEAHSFEEYFIISTENEILHKMDAFNKFEPLSGDTDEYSSYRYLHAIPFEDFGLSVRILDDIDTIHKPRNIKVAMPLKENKQKQEKTNVPEKSKDDSFSDNFDFEDDLPF